MSWGQEHQPANPAVWGPPKLVAAPATTSVTDVRCAGSRAGKACNALLAELVTSPWRIRCPKCHHVNAG